MMSWKEIKISQESYFMSSIFGEDDIVTFILYGIQKEPLYEVLTLEELKRKVKVQNRRYEYNEEQIRNTLAGGEVESATLLPEAAATKFVSEKWILKIKYRVKNCPFNYEWTLSQQPMLDFQSTVVKPLFTALIGCQEQNEILMENLKKKDVEILQYRKEGAILSRKTLATKLFDFEEFTRKYESRNKLVADFSGLAQFVVNAKPEKVRRCGSASPQKKVEKQEPLETKTIENVKPSTSPAGQKKRKMLEQQLLETKLKARQNCFEYESSQSQVLSSSQSTDEYIPHEIKSHSKEPPQKSETSSGAAIRTRRASRCTPLLEKDAKTNLNDHKTHSDSEDSVFTAPFRRSAKRLISLSQESVISDAQVKDKQGGTQKKEASSKDSKEQKGNCHKDATLAVDRSNGAASPRKEKTKSLNTQIQDVGVDTSKKQVAPSQSLGTSTAKRDERPRTNVAAKSLNTEPQEKNSKVAVTKDKIDKTPKNDVAEKRDNNPKPPPQVRKETPNNDVAEKRNNNPKPPPPQVLDVSDSETDEIILTPQKRKSLSLNRQQPKRTASADNNNKDKKKENSGRAGTEQEQNDNNETEADTPTYVVEISTDSECGEPHTAHRRGRKKKIVSQQETSSPFSMKSRITRSTPLVLTPPKRRCEEPIKRGKRTSLQALMSDIKFVNSYDNSDSDSSNKQPLAVGEISSQLEVIRKELESLEALRLADLKHRTCKA